jgi:hypothetical protein
MPPRTQWHLARKNLEPDKIQLKRVEQAGALGHIQRREVARPFSLSKVVIGFTPAGRSPSENMQIMKIASYNCCVI